MTKGGGFAFGPRGDHIADFHLHIVDDDPINESFHQLSALGKGHLVQSRLQALTGLDHGVGHPVPFGLPHCSSRWTEGRWWYLDRC